MTAKDYVSIESYVMMLKDTSSGTPPKGTISGGSSMVWKGNCVGMGHTKNPKTPAQFQAEGIMIYERDVFDKRHMFAGKWSITDAGSELLLDGNFITTTNKYEASNDKLTELVLDVTKDTAFKIGSGGKLTIGQTQVYSNSDTTDKTASMMWESSSFTSDNNGKAP
eukprot:Tbor_TRINITY_DN6228_c2_g1::TRINITY_DN6228_c2_g1_i9::g.1945::m.1945